AEQLVDRSAEHLAADVPERDVDAAHDGRWQAARAEVGRLAEQLVPDPVDVGRVLPDHELLDASERVADDQAAVAGVVRRLAEASDALVRVDLHESPRPLRQALRGRIDHVDLEIGDQHIAGPSFWIRGWGAHGDSVAIAEVVPPGYAFPTAATRLGGRALALDRAGGQAAGVVLDEEGVDD